MRDDFNKVLVNCYRVGGGILKPGRLPRDIEDLPGRESMRGPYKQGHYSVAKDFGENLSPLFRFLDKQVGRPWDKVYSELCSTFDMRKTINQHILQHVNQYVEQEALLVDNRVVRRGYSGRVFDVYGLYVHPVNGLLCRAKKRGPTAREKEAARKREGLLVRRHLGENKWLVNYEGSWYFVRLEDMPRSEKVVREVQQPDGTTRLVTSWTDPVAHDVLFKRSNRYELFTRNKARMTDLCYQYYGTHDKYAVWKKQASHQELKRHGVI
jgi:hypothetical protein